MATRKGAPAPLAFDQILSTLRRARKLSQEELAKAIGVHTNVLGRYERGGTKPSIEVAAKIAEALGVSLDQLVGRADVQLDKSITDRVLTLQRLPEKDRVIILGALDAMLRDAKARAAYS
jgi:transcriptional regulator with XRE-family HTH domain